jgi:phage terminase large subunit-like protein
LYRALSADASTAYGLSPSFVVHDELGQVKGPRSELYDALETATGAQESPLSLIISTQAPTDADLLSVLIDDAKRGHDPRVILSLYSADDEVDPFTVKAIRQANPAYGDFLNATEVRAMAEDARRMPARESEYRNLVLNQRVEAVSPFISKSIWNGCAGEVPESFEGLDVFAGLDLSETTDLTALVLVAHVDGKWRAAPTFWLPADGLPERARKDRVPYDLWHKQGFLHTSPGKSIEYDWVARKLWEVREAAGSLTVAFDRWNMKYLKPLLIDEGFTEQWMETNLKEFGQGFQSMSPALRTVEAAILNNRIVHGNNPVLDMCMGNAVVQMDPAGNRKLTKAKLRARARS